MRVAAAISPSATSPADTEPRNIVARPVDSAIVAARAPCRVKCSVVTNVTAAVRGSVSGTSGPVTTLMAFAHRIQARSLLGGDAEQRLAVEQGTGQDSQTAGGCGADGDVLLAIGGA